MQELKVIFERIQREPIELQRREDEAFAILFEETLRILQVEPENEGKWETEVGEEGWVGKNQ